MLKSQADYNAICADTVTLAKHMKNYFTVKQFVQGFGGTQLKHQDEFLRNMFLLQLVTSGELTNLSQITWK